MQREYARNMLGTVMFCRDMCLFLEKSLKRSNLDSFEEGFLKGRLCAYNTIFEHLTGKNYQTANVLEIEITIGNR